MRTELSQYQWWIMNRQWEWIPECWTRNSKTSLDISRCSGEWNYKVTPSSWMEVAKIGWLRHRWAQFSEVRWCSLMQTLVHQDSIQFSAERAANVVDLERQWWCGRTSAFPRSTIWAVALNMFCRGWTMVALTRWRTLLQESTPTRLVMNACTMVVAASSVSDLCTVFICCSR